MKICIYGGAFDPVHLGHLYIADRAREELGLDKVIFVPNGTPPWKESTMFTAQERVEMLAMSVEDNPYFDTDTFEVTRGNEPSYAYDTVIYFRNKYPDARLYFLIGSDILEGLHRWHRIDELSPLVTFACVERDEHKYSDTELERFKSAYHISYLRLPYLNISSTYIRHAIRSGLSYRYMVRDNVYNYISGADK